jgi:hypothetical protein
VDLSFRFDGWYRRLPVSPKDGGRGVPYAVRRGGTIRVGDAIRVERPAGGGARDAAAP